MKTNTSTEERCGVYMMLMKLGLFILLALSFFLLMAINNPQIIKPSRTAAITGFGFTLLLLLMMNLYKGFDIHREQSRHIIYSAFISAIIADAGTYFELLIMNFNEANRSNLLPEMEDIRCLLICIVLQLLWITLFTRSAKYIYYRMTPPRRCCIITGSQPGEEYILSKLASYRKRYLIRDVISNRTPNLEWKINQYDQVFLYDLPPQQRTSLIEYCYKICKPVQYGMELTDIISLGSVHDILDDAPFLSVEKPGLTLEQRIIKRTMDLILSSIALIILSPVMLLCAAAIYLNDHQNVIFHQPRMTLNGRIFEIYKFRTMRPSADPNHSATSDDDRITPVGRFLRRFRLDELPQLFNILKGDMSIVGPRPEMLSNIADYTRELPEFSYRLRVKAGLTGYAQIAGKYNTLPRDKMLLDLMYIENYSPLEDIKLMFRTITVFYKKDSTEGFPSAPAHSEFERDSAENDC